MKNITFRFVTNSLCDHTNKKRKYKLTSLFVREYSIATNPLKTKAHIIVWLSATLFFFFSLPPPFENKLPSKANAREQRRKPRGNLVKSEVVRFFFFLFQPGALLQITSNSESAVKSHRAESNVSRCPAPVSPETRELYRRSRNPLGPSYIRARRPYNARR